MDALEQWGPVCPAEDHFITSSYVAKGMHAEAIARAERAVEQFERNPRLLAALAEAYAAAGRTVEAQRTLLELEAAREERYVDPVLFALVYLSLGNLDAAFAELERAYDIQSAWLPIINVDPRMSVLHDDQRFQDLLRRIGIKPDRVASSQDAA
jgi:tetratricopeptide (TPR) repeat protein